MTRTPRRTRSNKILLATCFVLGIPLALFIFVFAALVAGDVMRDTSAVGGNPSQPDQPTEITCRMNEACELGSATITITKVTRDDVLTVPRNHRYEGHWVIVHFDYTNEGDKPGEASHLDTWKLEDSQGRIYTYAWERTSDHAIRWGQDLGSIDGAQPSIKTEGVIIFDTAPGASEFTLHGGDLIHPKDGKDFKVRLGI